MSFKALGVGLPKTGTSTLARALREAGIHAVHQSYQNKFPHAGEMMALAYDERLPIDHYVPDIEAVTQLDSLQNGKSVWPQMYHEFLMAFVKQNPSAIIILHTRRPKKTLASIKRWKDLRTRICSAPGLRIDSTDRQVVRWIEEHYQNMRRLFSHMKNFVEFDIDDDPEEIKAKLSEALGVDFPWWGVENGNPEPKKSTSKPKKK